MKRRAILIGSPSYKENGDYLSGVKTDIENMYRFLRSSIGGSWQKEEITIFYSNKSWSIIEPYLENVKNADMSFVYFSGHGFRDLNERDYIVLNKSENIDIHKYLANLSKHQITIIDACRSYPQYFSADGVSVLEGIEFPNPNPQFARDLYNKQLFTVANSRVLLNATEKGTNAIDGGSNYGGLFSKCIITSCKISNSLKSKACF
jgi:hypothetical protein